jgi:hypothetical protein
MYPIKPFAGSESTARTNRRGPILPVFKRLQPGRPPCDRSVPLASLLLELWRCVCDSQVKCVDNSLRFSDTSEGIDTMTSSKACRSWGEQADGSLWWAIGIAMVALLLRQAPMNLPIDCRPDEPIDFSA